MCTSVRGTVHGTSFSQEEFRRQHDNEVFWVLLNCGALINFPALRGDHHEIVVVDSARSVHLENAGCKNVLHVGEEGWNWAFYCTHAWTAG